MSDPSSSLPASSVSLWDGKGRRAVPLCILPGFQRGSLKRRSSWNRTQRHNDFSSRWSEEVFLQLSNLCSVSLLCVSVLSFCFQLPNAGREPMWQPQTRCLPTYANSCFHRDNVAIVVERPHGGALGAVRSARARRSESRHPQPAQARTPSRPLPATAVSLLLYPHHPLRPVSPWQRGVLYANQRHPGDHSNVSYLWSRALQGREEREASACHAVVFVLLVRPRPAAGWGGAAAGGGAGAAQGVGAGSQEAGRGWNQQRRLNGCAGGGQRNCLLPEP